MAIALKFEVRYSLIFKITIALLLSLKTTRFCYCFLSVYC